MNTDAHRWGVREEYEIATPQATFWKIWVDPPCNFSWNPWPPSRDFGKNFKYPLPWIFNSLCIYGNKMDTDWLVPFRCQIFFIVLMLKFWGNLDFQFKPNINATPTKKRKKKEDLSQSTLKKDLLKLV